MGARDMTFARRLLGEGAAAGRHVTLVSQLKKMQVERRDDGRREVQAAERRRSVDDGYGFDLNKPFRHRKRAHPNKRTRWRRPFGKVGPARLPDDGPVLRFVIHDIGRELDDVLIACAAGSKRNPDILHRLGGLFTQVIPAY